MKTIYFVRHGQAEGNASAVFKRPTAPLTDKGRAESLVIAKALATKNIELLVSGPLKRTVDTTEIIQSLLDIPSIIHESFSGVKHATSMAGKPKSGPEANAYLTTIKEMYSTNPNARFEDAENYSDFYKRLNEGFSFLASRPEAVIAVVTHETIIKSLLILILSNQKYDPVANIDVKIHLAPMTNTGITVCTFDGIWQLVSWNVN